MHIIVWLVMGFVAGLIARALMPGDDHMGIVGTTILGLVGSLVGGFLGNMLVHGRRGFTMAGLIGSLLGAFSVLAIVHLAGRRGHRPLTH
ncbi:MAG: GlsB/YeaQ/YmgE family stress response membrane protein [Actinomycetota bacterium]